MLTLQTQKIIQCRAMFEEYLSKNVYIFYIKGMKSLLPLIYRSKSPWQNKRVFKDKTMTKQKQKTHNTYGIIYSCRVLELRVDIL